MRKPLTENKQHAMAVNTYKETGLQVLGFLGITYPKNLIFGPERKVRKQATTLNDEWAR